MEGLEDHEGLAVMDSLVSLVQDFERPLVLEGPNSLESVKGFKVLKLLSVLKVLNDGFEGV